LKQEIERDGASEKERLLLLPKKDSEIYIKPPNAREPCSLSPLGPSQKFDNSVYGSANHHRARDSHGETCERRENRSCPSAAWEARWQSFRGNVRALAKRSENDIGRSAANGCGGGYQFYHQATFELDPTRGKATVL